jgi:hypothetical protein
MMTPLKRSGYGLLLPLNPAGIVGSGGRHSSSKDAVSSSSTDGGQLLEGVEKETALQKPKPSGKAVHQQQLLPTLLSHVGPSTPSQTGS